MATPVPTAAERNDRERGDDNNALRAALGNLLGTFGIERVSTHDRVVEAARATLTARGHRWTTVTLRYQELVVETSPIAARLLAADSDVVLAELERVEPGMVTGIVVVSVNGSGRRQVR